MSGVCLTAVEISLPNAFAADRLAGNPHPQHALASYAPALS
ncbi:MAG: hypothetical protein U5J83_01380 [Bryobacterales bacterium]|nr:hypothetical protein [Bryobacterales bacterium]